MANNSFKAEFDAALRRFSLAMESLPPDVRHPGVIAASSEICELLRIARFEAVLTEPKTGRTMGKEVVHKQAFHSESDLDIERGIVVTRRTMAASIAQYFVYPHIGAEDWSEEEMDCINAFVSSMFVFNGRARAMQICDFLTFHDAELDVYNLNYVLRRLEVMFETGEVAMYTAFRFNLRQFTIINNQLGRRGGTAIMKRYVHGLIDLIGDAGFVGRLGGDNFVGICKNEKLDDVRSYLVGKSIPTGDAGVESVLVSARTAYSPFTEDCQSSMMIMDRLSIIMGMLKGNPKLSYMDYNKEIDKRAENKQWVEALFPSALKNEEFLVYYQPKINLKNYTLSGAEALCRWKHDGELIPPFRFIPILEQSSNICLLDFYMLEHVCMDMRRWLDQGMPLVKVSVNISRVHLGSENLAARIIGIIKKYDIPNELIEIELTETTTDVDFTELKRIVAILHSVGISTSIDDFGIGYSSLNLIRELPWNVLKIDKSFLPQENEKNYEHKKIMLKYVIAMAQTLGLECIVEGVETLDHIALLKENNCFRAQGFFFDKPLPVEEFEERLVTKQIVV